jgi:hypothetical protein
MFDVDAATHGAAAAAAVEAAEARGAAAAAAAAGDGRLASIVQARPAAGAQPG